MLNRKIGALLVSSMLLLGACTVTDNPASTDGTNNGTNNGTNSGENTTAGNNSLTINGEKKEFAETAKVSISSTFIRIEQDVKIAEAEGGQANFSVTYQSRDRITDPKNINTSRVNEVTSLFFPVLEDGKVEIQSFRSIIPSHPDFKFEIKQEGNNLVGSVTRTKEPTMEYKFNVAIP